MKLSRKFLETTLSGSLWGKRSSLWERVTYLTNLWAWISIKKMMISRSIKKIWMLEFFSWTKSLKFTQGIKGLATGLIKESVKDLKTRRLILSPATFSSRILRTSSKSRKRYFQTHHSSIRRGTLSKKIKILGNIMKASLRLNWTLWLGLLSLKGLMRRHWRTFQIQTTMNLMSLRRT